MVTNEGACEGLSRRTKSRNERRTFSTNEEVNEEPTKDLRRNEGLKRTKKHTKDFLTNEGPI